MYTESVTSSVTKLYISETHNKHAGPYTCVVLDQLERRVAYRTITLLLYSKINLLSSVARPSAIKYNII